MLGHTHPRRRRTHDPGPCPARHPHRRPGPSRGLVGRPRVGADRPRRLPRRRALRDRELLARPGLLQLEPGHRRGPRRRHRPAEPDPGDDGPLGLHHRGAGRGGRRRRHGLDPVRDRHRSWPRPAAPGDRGRRRPRVHAAHHPLRAQGPRGAPRHPPADGRRARRRQAPPDLEGGASGGGREPRLARPSPTCWWSEAVRAASPWALGCASSACPAWSSTSTRAPATSGATATSRCACTTRSGTTTCPT